MPSDSLSHIQFKIYVEPWAQTFHIVDQLSHWSEHSHNTYDEIAVERGWVTWRGEALLANEARLRESRSWGEGWEQSLYVDANLRRSLKDGTYQEWITESEARSMARILRHFRPKFQSWLNDENPKLVIFADQIQPFYESNPSVLAFERLLGLTGPVQMELYLVPAPSARTLGGGANGGKLVVEVPSDNPARVLSTILHEASHKLMEPWKQTMKTLIDTNDQTHLLNQNTLEEAIAYALSDVIIDSDEEGVERQVEEKLARGDAIMENSHLRYLLYGLRLAPLLTEAFQSKVSFQDFLVEAIAAWQTLAAEYVKT